MTALDAFKRYTASFRTLNAAAVVPHYQPPALLISPRGVVALASGAEIERFYRQVMAELPGMGYATTDFARLEERQLAPDLALVTGAGTWKTAAGKELSRFGMSYLLRRVGEDWKITVAAVHEPEAS